MHKIDKIRTQSTKRDVGQIIALVILLILTVLVMEARAQEGSQGNTVIHDNGQMTFFGNHTFVAGGTGALPGIILTQRETATRSFLNYGPAVTSAITGADNASHVDGYIRKLGAGAFVFPAGDNGQLGAFGASADGTNGAYYFANPSSAITSNLFTGGSYGPLPGGTAFPTTSRGPGVTAVSTVEYWDIDGANATPITLTWDATSDVTTLTGGVLERLSILGWDGTKWVRIKSKIDVTSILGGASSLTAGSITTFASIVPNSFTVYTLGRSTPDLTPTITITPSVIAGTSAISVNITVFELNNVPTNGTMTLNTLVAPEWTIGITPGTVTNGWTYVGVVGSFHRFTSTQVIQNSSSAFSIPATFNPNNATGTFTFFISILSNSGGESPNTNNSDQETVTYEP